jgi:uncharacterized protein (DUF952 family)
MAVILHLLPESTWRALGDTDTYLPEAYVQDGFVHCSAGDDVMLAVANAFYADGADELVVWDLDADRLTSEVRWESPDGDPPPGVPAGTHFPHVYGAIDLAAVIRTRRLVSDGAGRFVGYAPID